MKKLNLTLMLLITAMLCFGQQVIKTITPNKDTVWTLFTPETVTVQHASVVNTIHPYIPVVSPKVTGVYPLPTFIPLPLTFNSQSKTLTINGQVGGKITGYSFDMNMDSVTCLILVNCKGVEVTGNRFTNSRNFGIEVNGGSNNYIHDNYFTNVANGVQPYKTTSCKVNHNQFLNINGNMPMVGHAIFFNYCPASGGQQANYNLIVNEANVAKNPHDQIAFYNSFGLPADSMQQIGNTIVGGQTHYRPDRPTASQNGAAGQTLGDQTGDYQVARYNNNINGGSVGWQTVGSSKALKYDHNIIYLKIVPPVNNNMTLRLGISVQDSQPFGSIYVGYNRLLVYAIDGTSANPTSNSGMPCYWNPATTPLPVGWSTNVFQDHSLEVPCQALIQAGKGLLTYR